MKHVKINEGIIPRKYNNNDNNDNNNNNNNNNNNKNRIVIITLFKEGNTSTLHFLDTRFKTSTTDCF